MTENEKRALEAVRRIVSDNWRWFTKDGGRECLVNWMKAKGPAELVGAAREGDADALELLREYARGARKTGINAPAELHEFVWEYFIDGPPKGKPGPSPKDNSARDPIIVALVKVASEEFGLPIYRNVANRYVKAGKAPLSACALVAQVVGLKERTIEEIWAAGKANAGR